MKVNARTIVDLAPKEAMQLYLDPELWLKVDAHCQKYELEDGTYDKKGSIIRYYSMNAGKLVIIEQQLMEVIEGEKIVLKASAKGYKANTVTTFEDVDGKTKIEENTEFKLTFIVKLVSPFFKKGLEKETQNMLDILGKAMENKANKTEENESSIDEISEDKASESDVTKNNEDNEDTTLQDEN